MSNATGGDGRAAVPLEAVKRHCCDGHALVLTETNHGQPLGIGRQSRLIPKATEHEGGFTIRKDFRDHWAFFRPDGIAVPDAGYISRLDDNPPAGGLSSRPESLVEEPSPPRYLH